MHKIVTVFHNLNGNVEPVVIDGAKYEADPTDPKKAKVGEDGKPVPFKENAGGGDKGGNADIDLEELAKTNPKVAKMLAEKKEADKKLADATKAQEEKERKEKEARGEFQKIAEDERKKREEVEVELEKKNTLLGKYVNSTKTILEEVMKTIPDEKKGLVPENFSAREKLEYITKNAKLLGATVAKTGKGGKIDENDNSPTATDEQQLLKDIDELIKKGGARTAAENQILWEKSKKLKVLRAANAKK